MTDIDMLEKIRKQIIDVAKRRTTIPYDILAQRVGLINQPEWFWVIGKYLGDINEQETPKGNPMISAIVVGKETGIPGDGFWICAYNLKVWDGKGDKEEFWKKELEKVWNHDWKK